MSLPGNYVLYAVDEEEQPGVLDDARVVTAAGLSPPGSVVIATHDTLIVERAPHRCTLKVKQVYGHAWVTLTSSDMTAASTRLCWEMVLGLHVIRPRRIWISTYSPDVAPPEDRHTPLLVVEERWGCVVTPQQLQTLIEKRVLNDPSVSPSRDRDGREEAWKRRDRNR
jgi:hypothetical protein